MKNPTIATLLNIIPGAGYLYVGGKRKTFGVFMLAGVVLSMAVGLYDPMYAQMSESTELRMIDWLYLLSYGLILVGFMYDAYVAAHEANKKASSKKSK